MEKYLWDKYLKKAIKPLKCICGREYHNNMQYEGGFIKQSNLIIWCCSKRCADKSLIKGM